MEYFVEYYPDNNDGETLAEELTLADFLGLISDHKERGIDPTFDFSNFTIAKNGRDGQRLTIEDEHNIFYC